MTVTQAGRLDANEQRHLQALMQDWERAEQIRAEVRSVVATYVGLSSYREVSRLTGFSTNTLQRWKREAQ